jgi:hypothetical protein
MDPYQVVATGLKAIIDTEFAVEGFTAIHDNIHEALGENAVAIGIAPLRETVRTSNAVIQETWVEVKFYDLWTKMVDPAQAVSPFRITGFAHRFRQAVQDNRAAYEGSPEIWYFDVTNIEYPNDPTGNKTRFIATIRAYGDNAALLETR